MKSGVKGITYRPAPKKWQVSVFKGDGARYIGTYENLDDAIAAQAKAELEKHTWPEDVWRWRERKSFKDPRYIERHIIDDDVLFTVPKDTRSLTGRVAGDPLFERSALFKKLFAGNQGTNLALVTKSNYCAQK